MITQSMADRIVNDAELLLVIGSRVYLRKKGRSYLGICPFCYEERFGVDGDETFFHCFSCFKSGNALTFLMGFEKISFSDAIKQLGLMQGIDLDNQIEAVERPVVLPFLRRPRMGSKFSWWDKDS